jgi:RNA polymerase sigma-70 factor (ECF subfamily)
VQGDACAREFESFFKSHYAGLARALFRIVGDTQAAEELASEALWKLHSRALWNGRNPAGWLYRTGFRLALDSLKKRGRRDRYEAQAQLRDAPATPLEILERCEREHRVRTALAALKPEPVSLLILRAEGHTLNEIAGILSLNPASVGTMLARADAALRKEYVKRYGKL